MEDLAWLAYSSAYLVIGLVFLFVGKKLFDFVTPYSVEVQLTKKDNPALGIVLVGFLLGILAVICSVFIGETVEPTFETFTAEVIDVAIYGILGIVLLLISGILNDKFILNRFSNRTEIIDRKNKAVALIIAAGYVGSGLVIAGAIYSSRSIVSALVMFAAGQVALILFAIIYQTTTRFNEQEQLEQKQNMAVGLAFAGNMLAFAFVLMKGVGVNPIRVADWTWGDRFLRFVYYGIAGCILLVIARAVADRIFMPSAKISDEVVNDQNVNAGLLEGCIVIAVGAMLIFCL